VQPHQTSLLGIGPPALDPDAPVARTWLDDGSWVDLAPGWLRGGDTLLVELVDSIEWQQGRRWMYDRMVDDPRLTCFFRRAERALHPALNEARAALESRYRVRLSGPGFNY
jgi:hypothetical protein